GRKRWGDYSFTSLDPADDMTVWTVQEYAESALDSHFNPVGNLYGTYVTSVEAPRPELRNSDTTVGPGITGATLVLTGRNFFEPGLAFPNHLSVRIGSPGDHIVVTNVAVSNGGTRVTVTFNTLDAGGNAAQDDYDIVLTNPDGQSDRIDNGLHVVNGVGG